MPKPLSYADAAKLLGDDKTVKLLDTALGGALLAATPLNPAFLLGLFDVKSEVARLGGGLIFGLRGKLSGLSRYDRTQRLEAAYVVIVLTAFFESVPASKLSKAEQLSVAGGDAAGSERLGALMRRMLHLDVPTLAAHRPYEVVTERLLHDDGRGPLRVPAHPRPAHRRGGARGTSLRGTVPAAGGRLPRGRLLG